MEQLEKLFANRPAALTIILMAYVGCVVGISGGLGMLYKIISYNPALR